MSKEISDIYNEMAETGKFPKEIKKRILVPIPKPDKKAGPPEHLRPIILLSTLRKILAMCMLRCLHKMSKKIPPTQAAYQQGRSTTEMVYTFKVLAEKATTSKDIEITLLLLDMSKAFDTVKRKDMFEILKEVLDDDELHIIKLLVENVTLQVKVGMKVGNDSKTNIGVPQEDCLSPILFIKYLAEALKPVQAIEHPAHISDYTYVKTNNVTISQQYADDISWITSNKQLKEELEVVVPSILKSKYLQVKESKTEEYEIKRGSEEKWKTCKYLRS